MGNAKIQQRKFVLKEGMTVDDIKNSKDATALQKKYASAFDTDNNGFSQREADVFNSTDIKECGKGVSLFTRYADGSKKETKFQGDITAFKFAPVGELKPYVNYSATDEKSKQKEYDKNLFDFKKQFEECYTKVKVNNDQINSIKQKYKLSGDAAIEFAKIYYATGDAINIIKDATGSYYNNVIKETDAAYNKVVDETGAKVNNAATVKELVQAKTEMNEKRKIAKSEMKAKRKEANNFLHKTRNEAQRQLDIIRKEALEYLYKNKSLTNKSNTESNGITINNTNFPQRKFVVREGMTVDDIKKSTVATTLQIKYASAFDTDGKKGFSKEEADLFNATTFSEKADGTVTFWTRQKDGTKKGTKFNSKDDIRYKSEDEVSPYTKITAKDKNVEYTIKNCSEGHMHTYDMKLYAGLTKEQSKMRGDSYIYFVDADLDNNSSLDKFEIIAYDLMKKNGYNTQLECYRDAYIVLKNMAKNDNDAKNLLQKYKKFLEKKEAENLKLIEKENYKKLTDGLLSRIARNAGFNLVADFLRDDWSGEQVRKIGLESAADWLEDKDKKCTDGTDDGKIGLWEGAKSLAKGLIGGIPKMMINNPLATTVTVGLGAAVTALTGGAILPLLGAIGIVTGIGMAGYGVYKAATAKTDGEAKQALETCGIGITTTALSTLSSGKTLEKAAEAGVKSAQVSKEANIFKKTVQMFKAIPECLTKSKEWVRFNLNIPVTKEFDNFGRTTKKIYGGSSYREYHYEYSCDKNCERLVNKTAPNGDYKLYDWITHDVIEEGSPMKGTYKKYYTTGKTKEAGNTKTGEYKKYFTDENVEEIGNTKTGEYKKFYNNRKVREEYDPANGTYNKYWDDGTRKETRNMKTGEYAEYDRFGRVEEEGNEFTKTYKRWTSSNEYRKYENGKYTGTYDRQGNRVKDFDEFFEDFFNGFYEYSRRAKGNSGNTASAKKVTLNDGEEKFINFISNKVAGGNSMSKSEMEDFAKLTGFTYEQIANMDKNTYRQLCIKYHPDRNTKNPLAERIFEIVQNIYNYRKAA